MVDTGKVWPDWKTVRIIGRGSFGTVYEIERDVFGHLEKAALKVISIPQNSSDIEDLYNDGYDEASITQRFESYLKDIVREYSLMAEMKGCNNIVYCDDLRYIQHDDGMGWDIYIKMELLESLPKVLGRDFSEKQIIKLGLDMCNALVVCKGKNIVHRDIKPQNIFVAEDGTYKLGDFGIAKTAERTTSGTKTGTYKYMAPEVYNNQPYGSAADIYSLGLVLYWLLNERRTPFLPLPPQVPSASAEDEARKKRFDGEPIPAPAHGSKELKAIVLKACAYDPSMRYANAADMKRDLETILYGHSVSPEADKVRRPVQYENDVTTGVRFNRERIHQVQPDLNSEHNADSDLTVSGFVPTGKKNGKKKPPNKSVLISLCALGTILLAAVVFYFTYHTWSEATCTEPQVCTICGKTGQDALGHEWVPATCTDQQYCNSCGVLGQPAIGHQWIEATTTAPKTCSVCEKTEGSAKQLKLATNIIYSVVATSTFTGDRASHSVYNLLDGRNDTNWTEGVNGHGIGEFIDFTFYQDYLLSAVTINAGNHYSKTYYEKNNRPKSITFTFSDGTSVEYTLQDSMSQQTITFDEPIRTSSLRITINSVYYGSAWDDTVISEISFVAFEEQY